MKNKNLTLRSFVHAMGVTVYVLLIAFVLNNGEKWFGKMNNLWGGFAMLMILVLSVAVVGIFIFGKSILLYLDNQKKEAIKLLFYIIGWLLFVTIITLSIYALV